MSRYRFTILMIAFLGLMVLYPILEHFKLTSLDLLLNVFATVLLLSCIYALSENRHQAVVATLVIVPSIFMDWAGAFPIGRNFHIFGSLYSIGANIFICYHLLRYALQAGVVDVEKIAAAVNVYLFFGLIWRDLYALTSLLIPGSFNSDLLSQVDFLYYSFVTLSTLGYGDVLPIHGPAKALAYLEAIIGQLYLTILVARLVGLHIAYTGPECENRD